MHFVKLNIFHISPREEGIKGDLASITKYGGFLYLPMVRHLYLTNYVENFVQVLRKHFREGWEVQANAYFAYLGRRGGSGIIENMLM